MTLHHEHPSGIETQAIVTTQLLMHHSRMKFFYNYVNTFGEERAATADNVYTVREPLNSPGSHEYAQLFDSAETMIEPYISAQMEINTATELYDWLFRDVIVSVFQRSPTHSRALRNVYGKDVVNMFSYGTRSTEFHDTRLKEYAQSMSFAASTVMLWLSQHDLMLPVIDKYTYFFKQHPTTKFLQYIPDFNSSMAVELAIKTNLMISSRYALHKVQDELSETDTPWEWFAPVWAQQLYHGIARPEVMDTLFQYFLYHIREDAPSQQMKTPIFHEALQNMST